MSIGGDDEPAQVTGSVRRVLEAGRAIGSSTTAVSGQGIHAQSGWQALDQGRSGEAWNYDQSTCEMK